MCHCAKKNMYLGRCHNILRKILFEREKESTSEERGRGEGEADSLSRQPYMGLHPKTPKS